MIGKKLRELIKLRNIKQNKLAKYLGISPSRLSNYLSDKREPDLEMLARMARFLSVDLNYFTEIKFPRKKGYASDLEEIETDAMESVAGYNYNDPLGVINIPYLTINSKKRAVKDKLITMSNMFFNGVEDASENVAIFEVTTGVGGEHFKQGDYIAAAKTSSVELNSGSLVFETGRNGRCYIYAEDNEYKMLITVDTKEVTFINDDGHLADFYKVLWVFSNISKFK